VRRAARRVPAGSYCSPGARLIDFPHAQEKNTTQEEIRREEKTNP
jgi:hypothetical protein